MLAPKEAKTLIYSPYKYINCDERDSYFPLVFHREHFTQHSQSVDAARRSAAARLESFGNTGGVAVDDALCRLCDG